jgi:CheY-like chemotaxis protein
MKPTALIVDDDIATRFVYTRVLSVFDIDIVEAGCVEDALTLLDTVIPQFILLDLRLPGGRRGEEVLQYLYAHPQFRDTRVLVITSILPEQQYPLRGHDDIMVKPVYPQAIRDFVCAAYVQH